MSKYIYIALTVLITLFMIVMIVTLVGDVLALFNPDTPPTSMYTSHKTALKLFMLAGGCLLMGGIMWLLKV